MLYWYCSMYAKYCFRCGREFFQTDTFCVRCGHERRVIESCISNKSETLEEILKHYFNKGIHYRKIVVYLKNYHNIGMSLSTLKRHLRSMGLKRNQWVPIDASIRRIIESEISNTDGIKGYRSIWHKLRAIHDIRVRRDKVMKVVREIDPEGCSNRRTQRLRRRIYGCPGPNAVWHADGYDKLKPFGFPIHGCVDGFSRKIIWLQVCRTNNNPVVPAHYFLTALKEFKVCPNVLRTDCGTENGIMASIQSLIHNDVNSHKYGTSQSNQRIENLWSHFKRTYTTWIINYFKEMMETDVLRLGDQFQMECLWFTYSELLQSELNKMRIEWNSHLIRKSRQASVCGIPDDMFFIPEIFGYKKFGRGVSDDTIDWILQQRNIHSEASDILDGCDDQFEEYFKYVIRTLGYSIPPRDWLEAREIYDRIMSVAFS